MTPRTGLHGIRIHLSGSVPEDASDAQVAGITVFVGKFARAVLRTGGTLVHGSHPTLEHPLKCAAVSFVSSGGSKDALTLVRAQKYAISMKNSTKSRRNASIPPCRSCLRSRVIQAKVWCRCANGWPSVVMSSSLSVENIGVSTRGAPASRTSWRKC